MKAITTLLPLTLLLAACGSLQPTAQVRDDVYDVPDRTAMAAASTAQAPTDQGAQEQQAPADDYYDQGQAAAYSQRGYYDMAYNDPYYYNYGRFGFNSMGPGFGYGMGYGSGIGVGMGMSYGWPYQSTWFNSPTGWYDPYWGNSWTSGYGLWGSPYNGYAFNPYSTWYDPFGYGAYSGYGYGPYMSPYGYCTGCYAPISYGGGSVVVAHRPGMSGSGAYQGTSGSVSNTPRMSYRDPVSLMRPAPSRTGGTEARPSRPATNSGQWNNSGSRPERSPRTAQPSSRPSYDRGSEHTPGFNSGGGSRGGFGGGGFGGGGNSGGGGGGGVSSPRPRR